LSSFMPLHTASGVQADALISGLVPSGLIRGGFPCRIFLIAGLFLSLTLIRQLGSLRFVYMHQLSIDLRAFRHLESAVIELALDARPRFQLAR